MSDPTNDRRQVALPTSVTDLPALVSPPPPTPALSSGDVELVDALRTGQRAAFATLVERYQQTVYGFLRARVLQAADAEDLTQEVFLRCYTAAARFDTSLALRPWLLGIARNLLRERARQYRRRKEEAWTELCLELDALTETDDTQEDDSLQHLPQCLDGLGDSARQAIELRYCSQLRLAEIGQRLRRSEGAAKLLMFRARQALKNCLDRKAGPDDV